MNIEFIETQIQFEQYKKDIDNHDLFVIILFADARKHYICNTVSCLYVLDLITKKKYILGKNHNDVVCILNDGIPFNENRVFTIYKKYILHHFNYKNCIDVMGLVYFDTNSIIEEDELNNSFVRLHNNEFYDYKDSNLSLSIFKFIENSDTVYERLKKYIENSEFIGFDFFNNVIIPTLYDIEKNGLVIEPTLLDSHFSIRSKRFIEDNMVHSEYNPYTTTGRPSNKFGGINFSAINKHDGSRDTFISRFNDGQIVTIDFESYHLRLISTMIQYELPSTSVHEFFGKQYFETDTLTEEQYEQSKQITFSFLYGNNNINDKIDFFKNVDKYIDELWKSIMINRYLESPISKRRIKLSNLTDMNESKAFNYLVQLTEAEFTIRKLKRVCELMRDLKSKIILYLYDSITIDLEPSETHILKEIVQILEDGGKYPTRVYTGKNYGEMIKIK